MQKRFLTILPVQRPCVANSSHTRFLFCGAYHSFLHSRSMTSMSAAPPPGVFPCLSGLLLFESAVQYSPSTKIISSGQAVGPSAKSAFSGVSVFALSSPEARVVSLSSDSLRAPGSGVVECSGELAGVDAHDAKSPKSKSTEAVRGNCFSAISRPLPDIFRQGKLRFFAGYLPQLT